MSRFFKIGLFMLSISLMSTTCSSDDDGPSNSNAAIISAIENAAEGSGWTITLFFDTDSDETSDFNGYEFSFNTDGSLVATNGTNSITGNWSVTDDSNSNDDSSDDDDIDFNINFTSPADFNELSDDWDVVSYTSTKIELRDVSGGNGGTDLLTFER